MRTRAALSAVRGQPPTFEQLLGGEPQLGPYVLPGNNYHVYDYPLFWANLRADAERRVAAFLAR